MAKSAQPLEKVKTPIGSAKSISRTVARSAPRRRAWVPCEWRRKCGETSASRPALRAAAAPDPTRSKGSYLNCPTTEPILC
jgi:hypothetical protein